MTRHNDPVKAKIRCADQALTANADANVVPLLWGEKKAGRRGIWQKSRGCFWPLKSYGSRERENNGAPQVSSRKASPSEEAGQHGGSIHKVLGSHNLAAEEDWQPVQLVICTATSVDWHHLQWHLHKEHFIIPVHNSHTRNTPLLSLVLEGKNLETLFLLTSKTTSQQCHEGDTTCKADVTHVTSPDWSNYKNAVEIL